jgi:hypothetical protein
MSIHNRHSLNSRPSAGLPGGSSFDARFLLNASEDIGTGVRGGSGSTPNDTISPLANEKNSVNSASTGSNVEGLRCDPQGNGGGGELRESLLSEVSSNKGDPTAQEEIFDPMANPASFESQSCITKLIYSIFCLQWHDNVFDRDEPMAPQM